MSPRTAARGLAAAVLLLLSLSACTGPPWTLSRTTDEITLRWYADDTSAAAADGTARAYCSALGKSATMDQLQRDGVAAIGRYHCG